MNSWQVIFFPILWPCRSVLSSIIAQVRQWTPSFEVIVSGLQEKYLLEKCINTLSRSWVSPTRENAFKKYLRDWSSVIPVKSKNFRYSSATSLLNSLFLPRCFATSDLLNLSRWYKRLANLLAASTLLLVPLLRLSVVSFSRMSVLPISEPASTPVVFPSAKQRSLLCQQTACPMRLSGIRRELPCSICSANFHRPYGLF